MNKYFIDFTNNNIEQFKNKYQISNDNFLLNQIKTERRNIKNFIRNNKINITKNRIKDSKKFNNKIKEYSDAFFVDKNVINSLDNLTEEYEFTWLDNKISIKSKKEVKECLKKRIHILIYIIEYLKQKTNNNRLDIYLVLTDLKKLFPENKIIDIEHVNTGYTDFNKNIIFIWRYEEFEKVLFHELVHFFDMDHKDKKIHIEKLSSIKPKNYHEAITDFWGILYHLIYVSLITQFKMKTLLECELEFMRNQASYLNKYFNYGKNINQKTAAYSYYILKYLLFDYITNNEIDINKIDNYQNILNKISNNSISNNYIKLNSSRMTLFQLY